MILLQYCLNLLKKQYMEINSKSIQLKNNTLFSRSKKESVFKLLCQYFFGPVI